MQIALHDIRRIGYLKIFNYFGRDLIIKTIKEVNTKIYNHNASSYGFLKNGVSKTDSLLNNYYGFCSLIDTYTPLVENIGADDYNKRKFRNTWCKIWKNFEKDLNSFEDTELDKDSIKIISDCGIRLANYLITNYNVDDENMLVVLNFYNVILKWSILLEKELNFKKNNMTHIKLLETMSILNGEDFIDYILNDII